MSLSIAPTEPAPLKAIGEVSSLPERFGVDVMWSSPHGLIGVQRKEWKDLIQSLPDGRLARELDLATRLAVRVLIVEGHIPWTRDGKLARYAYTKHQHHNLLLSVQAQGTWVVETDDLAGTIESVRWMQAWTEKDRHDALLHRPKPSGVWGKASPRDVKEWVLQSIPGCGPDRARRIIEHFGSCPISWTCDERQLCEVPGIGKVLAKRLHEALR